MEEYQLRLNGWLKKDLLSYFNGTTELSRAIVKSGQGILFIDLLPINEWLPFSLMNRWGQRCVCRVIISHVKNASSLKYILEGNFVLNMMRLEGKSEVW
jgi:hypothetical protein